MELLVKEHRSKQTIMFKPMLKCQDCFTLMLPNPSFPSVFCSSFFLAAAFAFAFALGCAALLCFLLLALGVGLDLDLAWRLGTALALGAPDPAAFFAAFPPPSLRFGAAFGTAFCEDAGSMFSSSPREM